MGEEREIRRKQMRFSVDLIGRIVEKLTFDYRSTCTVSDLYNREVVVRLVGSQEAAEDSLVKKTFLNNLSRLTRFGSTSTSDDHDTLRMIEVCSLGLFILDTFEFRSAKTSSTAETTLLKRDEGVIGGGGTYAICGSRVWLPAPRVGILVDRGKDWNSEIQNKLDEFGKDMWTYREKEEETTKALNLYIGQHRGEITFLRLSCAIDSFANQSTSRAPRQNTN